MRNASLGVLGLWSVLLTGCAVPEARLRSGLIDAGLSRPLSACMAARMVDRLNLAQLRRMGDLPRAQDAVTLDQFLRRVRALGDPEIWTVTTASTTVCTVSG
jgi:hypothetical protein